jgi:DtxR family transcriptional regulator, manganese transport regulator
MPKSDGNMPRGNTFQATQASPATSGDAALRANPLTWEGKYAHGHTGGDRSKAVIVMMTATGASTRTRRAAEHGDSLPAELTQARRFGKTRTAQSTALLEDYVELIDDLLTSTGEARPTDIARRLGVSHATAIKTIARLKRAGMATAKPYRGVFLTEVGTALAQRVRARHRLVVDVLRAIGVPAEAAEADAEGIEHHVSETTLKAFARFVQGREK